MLQIYCKNTGETASVEPGTTLLGAAGKFGLDMPYGLVSARVNNVAEGLNFRLYKNKDVEYLDVRDMSAMRTYVRSLCFILCKAVADLYPMGGIKLEHPVSRGYYCHLDIGKPVTEDDVSRIRARMRRLVDADMPFRRVECRTSEAMELFDNRGMYDKVKLLATSGSLYTVYYTLGDTMDYYYGSLVPSTGYVKVFDIIKYYDGILLRIPSHDDPTRLDDFVRQDKMLDVFKQHLHWMDILGLSNVGDLNEAVLAGHATEIINVSEALQEKIIANIADTIAARQTGPDPVRMVLISGPSSSGKTTFSKRLSIQLMANGIKPYPVSLDNYFVERTETPRGADGEYDYESLHAIDLDLFNSQLNDMLAGREVSLPTYNFLTGKKEYRGDKLRLTDNMVLILEGIHGLNPALTPHVPDGNKFKVYVSALTSISLDDHNWIPTTDNRLLRRILRDYNTRGYSAEETIRRWPTVRAGEDKWIFPYQENADVMFNSALLYEFAVLRSKVEPILAGVRQDCPEYAEAYRLLRFLRYFTPIPGNEIPPTSLVREFLGGSSFTY